MNCCIVSFCCIFFSICNSCGSKRSNNCVHSGASEQAVLYDPQQAESLIACGLLKRATAMTNSNSQSRCVLDINTYVGL